jgi:hypothetical protein
MTFPEGPAARTNTLVIRHLGSGASHSLQCTTVKLPQIGDYAKNLNPSRKSIYAEESIKGEK